MTPIEALEIIINPPATQDWKSDCICQEAIETVRKALTVGSWLSIDDAPVGISGHVWDPKNPSRTDLMGTVHEFDPGNGIKERYVVGAGNTGMKFTHWHPFPEPAKPLPSLQDKDR